ncbi:MAG: mammalian cell entry protein, partial [Mycobacterium sp.]
APTAFQNFLNIYQPAQATLSGALAVNQFSNPVQFLCAAVQAAARLGAKESAKLCVQYLAPIFKNRQYNFPPLGENLFVGTSARPNELTYSEDWLRPDYVPPPPPASAPGNPPPPANGASPLAAESPGAQPVPTNPSDGLRGLMTLPGGGH